MRRSMAITFSILTSFVCGGVHAADGAGLNPDISLILDGRATDLELGDVERELPGFQLGPETGPGEDGFALGEAELVISANVDDRFYGYMAIGIHSEAGETEVELEEAFIETLMLPHGLTIKAGRLFSHIGYQNLQHAHTWDFVDASLPQRAFLANNFGDAGVHVRWLAPTDLYLEFGIEAFQGDGFPAGGSASGTWSLYTKFGGDISDSSSWIAGLSHLSASAAARAGEHHHDETLPAEPGLSFTGDSDLSIADFTYKWSPRGNWRERNLSLSAAYYARDEEGVVDLALDPIPETGGYRGDQAGYYLQAVYQFRPRWRIGARFDGLSSDNQVIGLSESTTLDEDAHSPHRVSLMADFSYSEYSRLRLQFNRDDSAPLTDDQVHLQFIMSLGPHGAHRF